MKAILFLEVVELDLTREIRLDPIRSEIQNNPTLDDSIFNLTLPEI
jgi:hypothetical protein